MRLSFTKRELEIVEALAARQSAKQIAEKAGAKEDTVRGQIDELQRKLYATSQSEIPDRFRELTGWSGKPTQFAHDISG